MKPVEQRFCFDNRANGIHDDCKAALAATLPTREPVRRRSAAKTWLQAIALTARLEARPHRLFADIVEEWGQRQPGRPALLSDRQSLTYGELTARINRYARGASASVPAAPSVC